ncbi:MAG: ABC transporter substrate-binding protein [Acidobacteria bacterium]|nr:ABC transporter substrate-binding protein [Acidobacteriota bacterium]
MKTLMLFGLLVRHTHAQDVVSLAPNLTEICCALGACDRLAGVTDYCTYPEQVKSLPHVGGYLDPNIEIIVSLNPRIILAVPEHQQITKRLQGLGFRVETIQNFTVADIHDSIMRVGEILGLEQAAAQLSASLKQQQTWVSPKVPLRCLVSIGKETNSDGLRSVFAVARAGFLNELLEMAGGTNVLVQSTPYFTQLSQEAILGLDPDVIIELVPEDTADRDLVLAPWYAMNGLRAAREKRIYAVVNASVLTPGPRYPQTLELMRRALWP